MGKDGSFVGGSLSFKGDKKKPKKKKKKTKTKLKQDNESTTNEPELTPTERKAAARHAERTVQDLRKMAKKSHRQRVEEFNAKLGNLTEHNDIPRVRIVVVAAGDCCCCCCCC